MTAPVYLLTGESFLTEEALERVRGETDADPLSEAWFDADADVAQILEALATSSLLGGRRLVVVRDAHELKKDQVDALAGYLASPSPESVLVLVASGRTKLDAAVKKAGAVVSLDAPKGRRLIGWLRERARARGLKLDERAAWALTDAVGTELRDLDAALEQLGTALGTRATIAARDVRGMFPRLADERIYVLTDAVGERKTAVAMETLRRLLDQGEQPLVLLGALVNHVRRLLYARAHAERSTQAVADVLGMPGWRAERMQRQALAYREDELVAAMAALADADVEMKSGESGEPEIALEKAVLRVVRGSS